MEICGIGTCQLRLIRKGYDITREPTTKVEFSTTDSSAQCHKNSEESDHQKFTLICVFKPRLRLNNEMDIEMPDFTELSDQKKVTTLHIPAKLQTCERYMNLIYKKLFSNGAELHH